jgi:hypothetical protein
MNGAPGLLWFVLMKAVELRSIPHPATVNRAEDGAPDLFRNKDAGANGCWLRRLSGAIVQEGCEV